MKSKILLFVLFITILGCSDDYKTVTRYVCSCEEHKQLQEFMKTSIPLTTQNTELSDVNLHRSIGKIYYVGVKTFCHQELIITTGGPDWKIDTSKTKLDEGDILMDLVY